MAMMYGSSDEFLNGLSAHITAAVSGPLGRSITPTEIPSCRASTCKIHGFLVVSTAHASQFYKSALAQKSCSFSSMLEIPKVFGVSFQDTVLALGKCTDESVDRLKIYQIGRHLSNLGELLLISFGFCLSVKSLSGHFPEPLPSI